MDDFALTAAERQLFQALEKRGVRYLVIGLSAAVLEGAPVATQDIALWLETIDDRVAQAAADAKGFWVLASACSRRHSAARSSSGLTSYSLRTD